jgi:hypothetical protein
MGELGHSNIPGAYDRASSKMLVLDLAKGLPYHAVARGPQILVDIIGQFSAALYPYTEAGTLGSDPEAAFIAN